MHAVVQNVQRDDSAPLASIKFVLAWSLLVMLVLLVVTLKKMVKMIRSTIPLTTAKHVQRDMSLKTRHQSVKFARSVNIKIKLILTA